MADVKNVVGGSVKGVERFTKDADHIKHIIVTAGEDLKAGQKVVLCSNGTAYAATGHLYQGVVDPFGKDAEAFKDFRMLICPDLCSEVRHDFEFKPFPALIPESKKTYSDEEYDGYDGCGGCVN